MSQQAKERLESELPGTEVTLHPVESEGVGKVYKIAINGEVWYDVCLKPAPMPLIIFYAMVYGSPFTVNKTPVAGWNTPMNLKEHKRFGEPKEEMFGALKTAVEAA